MPKKMPMKIGEEAMKWVKIASGYTGECASAYATRVLTERAKSDVEKLHKEIAAEDGKLKGKR